MAKRAVVNVSFELLASLLRLPKGAEIICQASPNTQCIAFVVEHEGLRDVPEEYPYPAASPQFRKQDDDVVFLGWGQ